MYKRSRPPAALGGSGAVLWQCSGRVDYGLVSLADGCSLAGAELVRAIVVQEAVTLQLQVGGLIATKGTVLDTEEESSGNHLV